MINLRLSVLRRLEAESIHVIREVVAEFERPVMLYSVGKDSSTMIRLAQKAFYPGKIPFPLLHVDTGYKFREMYDFRDSFCKELGANLIVHHTEHPDGERPTPWRDGTVACCASLKTKALLKALAEGGYDAALGGARRDEERSRAKERIYSFRDQFGQWDPKNQRPELWNVYNAKIRVGESIRVFPLSNWTELDIWQYIQLEKIPLVPLYFAAERAVIRKNGLLIPVEDKHQSEYKGQVEKLFCRFRTLGCYPCTGAILSNATTLQDIIQEMMLQKHSERIARIIDHDVDGSMEQKKREGYF